jgi:putative FmdB family regulatory protein
MPTYDYECGACEHSLEVFQGINDPVLKKCPKCGKNKLKRQFGTGAAIVFKGSGFYQTDYRSEGYKKAAAAESKSHGESKGDAKSGDSHKSEAKSESTPKSETKSEPKKSDGASKKKKTGD